MRDDRGRLLDILESIVGIQRYAEQGRPRFEEDELVQTWMLHHLQVIGEAARALSPDFRSEHTDVPWPKVIGMRNILVHDYFRIDADAVWSAIESDLPSLKRQVEAALEEMSEDA